MAGVPESVVNAVEIYISPAQQAWDALTASLNAGDLSSAQTALNAYTAALPGTAGTTSEPSSAFLSDLTALGSSLQAGSISDARSDFANARLNAPSSAAQDVFLSEDQASFDGWIAVYGLEHAQGANTVQLASDISSVDSSLREENTYIADALVAQGYGKGAASSYASEITGIANGSAQGDSAVDATRATQWIQGLIQIAQGAASSPGYSNLQAPLSAATKNAVSTELSSVLFLNAIDSGKLLQTLIAETLGNSSSGGASDASANGSGGTSATVNLYA